MKKMMILMMTMVMIAVYMISSASAEAKKIDVLSLKTIEANDTCAVKVIRKDVELSVSEIRFGDSDNLNITIRNDLDQDIVSVTIVLVAYDNEFEQVEIGNGFGSITGIHEPQTISGKIRISRQSEKTVTFKCNADSFTGVRMIVSEYQLANGTAVKNETANEWLSKAYAGQTTVTIDYDEEKDYSGVTLKPGETINPVNLGNIEKADTFPVKVSDKKVTYNTGNGILATDKLKITIRNERDIDIYNPVVYVVSFNENLEPKSLDIIRTDFPYVQVLTAKENEPISIPANSEEVCVMDCEAKDIAGMRAIIASYEDANGVRIDNPYAELWLNQMLESNVYSLD